MVADAGMLNKTDVVAYVGANAGRFGLDPAAVLAVANQEGLNTTPGSTWGLANEGGSFNFGPPSWNSGWPGNPAAGTPIVQAHGSEAASWAWTPAGLDYWLQKVSEAGASGMTSYAAIRQIVTGFERPRADLVQGEINKALRDYPSFQQQLLAGPGGNPIVPVPGTPGGITLPPFPVPGQTGPGQLPIPSNPQKPAPAPKGTAKFSLHLFDLPTGPVNFTLPWDFSGILLFLAAIFAIIIGALLWKPSRDAGTNIAIGAMA